MQILQLLQLCKTTRKIFYIDNLMLLITKKKVIKIKSKQKERKINNTEIKSSETKDKHFLYSAI